MTQDANRSAKTAGKRRRIDWENIHVSSNGTITRTNMAEVVSKYLDDVKRIRESRNGK